MEIVGIVLPHWVGVVTTVGFLLVPVVEAPLMFKLNAPLMAIAMLMLSFGPVISFVMMIVLDQQATGALSCWAQLASAG